MTNLNLVKCVQTVVYVTNKIRSIPKNTTSFFQLCCFPLESNIHSDSPHEKKIHTHANRERQTKLNQSYRFLYLKCSKGKNTQTF